MVTRTLGVLAPTRRLPARDGFSSLGVCAAARAATEDQRSEDPSFKSSQKPSILRTPRPTQGFCHCASAFRAIGPTVRERIDHPRLKIPNSQHSGKVRSLFSALGGGEVKFPRLASWSSYDPVKSSHDPSHLQLKSH